MTITSPKLGKELYEVSGWEPPFFTLEGGKFTNTQYDVCFLLEKLQKFGVSVRANGFGTWEAETDSAELGDEPSDQYEATMNTPPDAVALLAIHLFKAGVL